MDTTEKEIRNLFANRGELDRDEIALLLLQLVERIQNLENAKQRTWVGLTDEETNVLWAESESNINFENFSVIAYEIEARLKELNT